MSKSSFYIFLLHYYLYYYSQLYLFIYVPTKICVEFQGFKIKMNIIPLPVSDTLIPATVHSYFQVAAGPGPGV